MMNNEEIKNLCIQLATSETEKDVVNLLKRSHFWDDPTSWRFYGDKENNFATIGNQQTGADKALAEKIVNSVDAMLMKECLMKGIHPESPSAPSSIKEAQKMFYKISDGKLSNLETFSRTRLAQNILLVATGQKSRPTYAIIDQGEGQTPKRMPETFLSIDKSNKIRISFVQGKFNMGGTGVLQFCSPNHNLELIITKRCPCPGNVERDDTRDFWGFTIVRREEPPSGVKHSIYKYLAPQNKILMFKSDTLPILPGQYPEAYGKPMVYGSFVKLYEYNIKGYHTTLNLDPYYRFSYLLPDIALPVMMVERRDYGEHSPSIMSGLSVRLNDDKRENIELEFPTYHRLSINDQEFEIKVYLFKKDKRRNYSKGDPIVFTINGQSHGFLPQTFFSRKEVSMDYLKEDIMIIVDCSKLSSRIIEDLFMNSRDRLRDCEFKDEIEKELQYLISKHPGLREYREKRRSEDIGNKLKDSKSLINLLENIIKKSPTLSKILPKGSRILNPIKTIECDTQESFQGNRFPLEFKLIGDFQKDSPKKCPINQKFRVQYETDVENNYFGRDDEPGTFILRANGVEYKPSSLNMWNGICNLNVEVPRFAKVNEIVKFESEVFDSRPERKHFNANFCVKIMSEEQSSSGSKGNRVKPIDPSKTGKEREKPEGLGLPNITPVKKNDEELWKSCNFEQDSCLCVKGPSESGEYDFFINMDNTHLLTEIKYSKEDVRIIEEKYKIGMVLVGMSILNYFEKPGNNKSNDGKDEIDISSYVTLFTKALSPFFITIVNALNEISDDEQL